MDGLAYGDIAAAAMAIRPDIIGVHMVYQWKRDAELFHFLEQIKAEFAPYTTAYGFYPTIAFEDILSDCSAIDSVILGEPEQTFKELADAVTCKAHDEYVEGTAVRAKSGGRAWRRRAVLKDINALPFPVRTGGMYRVPEVNIQGSRGCYGKCTFCYINPFYGERHLWRGRSPENIIREIDEIIADEARSDFYFTDPNFFGAGLKGQERSLQLASLLKQRGVKFGLEGRVNDIHDSTIEALVEAGLRHVFIGLESGRDGSLRRLNKMTTVAQNENALRVLRKHGIEPNIGFIMFEPDSSLGDVRANFEFLRRNGLLENLPVTANALYHFQIVLRGTPAYRELRRAGRIETPHSSYEGIASFVHADAAMLASAMRDITNFLFQRLHDVWSGKSAGSAGPDERYARVNRLLVDTFESILNALEKGRMSKEEIESMVHGAEREMDRTLNEHI